MEEVIAAAKAANIHNFVTALPAGYETNVIAMIPMSLIAVMIMTTSMHMVVAGFHNVVKILRPKYEAKVKTMLMIIGLLVSSWMMRRMIPGGRKRDPAFRRTKTESCDCKSHGEKGGNF